MGWCSSLLLIGRSAAVKSTPRIRSDSSPRQLRLGNPGPCDSPDSPGRNSFWRDIGDGEVMVDGFLQGLAGQRTAVGKINKAIVNQLHPDG
jgi:hypothetical protein